ncbi:pyridoxamine 5'-phosphate oxidase family protein [Granulicella sibirica]|uniref:General stress protein n=1 Tax=Granulicella sibirica TaxID=2479048 RepID=A0A4Q0T253_9BACT|nr:pyridoxamine 5'-phosphate oxidase family protein [Granulicella sibirica]RXH56902.1 General stress protein [Granulicella sibirica]
MTEEKHLTGPEGLKKIGELIKHIKIAMMTTANPDGSFDSRPMATQTEKEFDGKIWFLTRNESGKVEELKQDSHVSLLYADQGDAKYISIKGRANLSRDRSAIHDLWNPMYKAWFPQGEEDPAIAVLWVEVEEAEYWEASSSRLVRGVRYLAAAATGGRVNLGETGKITVNA